MAATFSALKLVDGTGISIITGVLAFSGSYVTSGDTLPDFNNLPSVGIIRPSQIIAVDFYGQNGYTYQWIPNAATNAQKCKISTTANTELAAGAYPAGITGDTIKVVVTISTAPR